MLTHGVSVDFLSERYFIDEGQQVFQSYYEDTLLKDSSPSNMSVFCLIFVQYLTGSHSAWIGSVQV
jgi:hypothetical protein